MTNNVTQPLATGQCACGSLTYGIHRKPMFVHCCHCTYCQRESGTAFATNALIEKDAFEVLTGAIEEASLPTESGKGQRAMRCSQCRSVVYSHYAYGKIADHIIFLRVGTLDVPGLFTPDIQVFCQSKLDWVKLDEKIPAVPTFYKASEYWPKESLARRAALFELVS